MNWDTMNINEIKRAFENLMPDEQQVALEVLINDSRKGVVNFANKIIRNNEKRIKEEMRVKMLWQYENEAYEKGYQCVAGTDEVGRGTLAGPVVAATVVLPKGLVVVGINDSKKLSEKKRLELNEIIKEKALFYSIQEVSPEVIDRINILHAAELAMSQSVEKNRSIDYLLVDGDNAPNVSLSYRNIIKGDSKSISIAAASILAKVYRDNLMDEYAKQFPEYGFERNKGYGTAEHYDALHKYGPTPIHRRSFRLY